MFGALNTFSSGLAFIGFLVALQLQRKDLRVQSAEMSCSRMENEEQTRQFREQTRILEKQRADEEINNKIKTCTDLILDLDKQFAIFDRRHQGVKFMDGTLSLFLYHIYYAIGKPIPNKNKAKMIEHARCYHELQMLFNKSISRIYIILSTCDPDSDKHRFIFDLIQTIASGETKQALSYYLYLSATSKLYRTEDLVNAKKLMKLPPATAVERELMRYAHDVFNNLSYTELNTHLQNFATIYRNQDLKDNI